MVGKGDMSNDSGQAVEQVLRNGVAPLNLSQAGPSRGTSSSLDATSSLDTTSSTPRASTSATSGPSTSAKPKLTMDEITSRDRRAASAAAIANFGNVEDVLCQNRRTISDFLRKKIEEEAAKNWDKFYKANENRFFKNKNWTDREFAELRAQDQKKQTGGPTGDCEKKAAVDASDEASSNAAVQTELEQATSSTQEVILLEVGCGPGNMLYPALANNASLKAHACDFSTRAIDLVTTHPQYDTARINAFTYDLTSNQALLPQLQSHPFGRPNVISLIFVLSAIPPSLHAQVLQNLAEVLPEGGSLVFRDFAFGDLTQLRYHWRKDRSWVEPSCVIVPDLIGEDAEEGQENACGGLYRRGDNTLTYYFRVAELQRTAELAGLEGPVTEIRQEGLNRKTGVVLRRRFVQANWKKKAAAASTVNRRTD
ncbi:S-adenosyl-L-methionine-dependent methyltransferase [Ceraceosorus guamensis]|uniref:S-adenosyl-L-methionine-dependent methyltransferase n=1 Tax=Ceraceosorus guamensis TaxID=1522189 RepID=A0A316VT01_9BASI|nr:S-adenosyl-L-methionine-dependent methyltransferase [Ceraceosorus guamensis]PWN40717.1 S-adenosyl-L-methionine-dependent methyltransferase [Ceraceosorus guamensis]